MSAGSVETVLVGFAAGILSGAFGVGGGLVTTPAIRLILGYPELVAVGTPLPVIIPTAVAGALSYKRRGMIDVRAGMAIGLYGAPTAILGAWLASVAGGQMVLLLTALLITYMALDTLLQAVRGPSDRPAAVGREHPRRGLALAGLGVLAGLYSGFLGLGGGFVIVPVLTRWFGMDIKRAIGTSLTAVTLLAIPGTIAHAYLGHVDWELAALLTLGVVPGALIGARLTQRASARGVGIAFSVLLLITGGLLAANELGLL